MKPIKFAHLLKLANQSMLKAHVIEITKACVAAFMKARNSLVIWERKKTEDSENVFFKALAKIFLLTWKCCSWPTFYQMDFMKR